MEELALRSGHLPVVLVVFKFRMSTSGQAAETPSHPAREMCSEMVPGSLRALDIRLNEKVFSTKEDSRVSPSSPPCSHTADMSQLLGTTTRPLFWSRGSLRNNGTHCGALLLEGLECELCCEAQSICRVTLEMLLHGAGEAPAHKSLSFNQDFIP